MQLPLGEVGSLDTRVASDASKTIDGALAGITQVMTQSWIVELNYSYSWSHGYLNDPYKVVSILNTHLGGLTDFRAADRRAREVGLREPSGYA